MPKPDLRKIPHAEKTLLKCLSLKPLSTLQVKKKSGFGYGSTQKYLALLLKERKVVAEDFGNKVLWRRKK